MIINDKLARMIVVNSNISHCFRNRLNSVLGGHLQFVVRKMSNKCKVAVVQFTATNNKTDNLNTVTRLIKDAVEKNAKVNI